MMWIVGERGDVVIVIVIRYGGVCSCVCVTVIVSPAEPAPINCKLCP